MKSGAPIPSFTPLRTQQNGAADGEVSIKIEPQWLLQLESALQLHFARAPRLSFSEFSRLIPKLSLGSTNTAKAVSVANTPSDSVQIDAVEFPKEGLSHYEDRLWHDLICVASPSLYQVKREKPDKASTKPGGIKDSYLVCPKFKGNRWKELRRLMMEAQNMGVSKSLSTRLHDMLLQERNQPCAHANGGSAHQQDQPSRIQKKRPLDALLSSSSNQQHRAETSTSTSPASNKVAKTGSTLEERVRARATEREQILENAKQAANDPIEEQLQVADILYMHASHVLRRQNVPAKLGFRNPTQAKSAPQTRCVLTFVDAMQLFPNESRKQLSSLLRNIQKIVPNFIRMMDAESILTTSTSKKIGPAKSFSKQTTLWIQTADFKNVRLKLGGKSPSFNATTLSSVMRKQPTVSMEKSVNDKKGRPELKKSTPAVRSLFVAETSSDSQPTNKTSKARSNKGKRVLIPTAHVKKEQVEIQTPQTQQTQSEMPGTFKKRKRRLRINPNFILCDADHDGGEIIQPTFNSPRSLKRLMDKMNAGERI